MANEQPQKGTPLGDFPEEAPLASASPSAEKNTPLGDFPLEAESPKGVGGWMKDIALGIPEALATVIWNPGVMIGSGIGGALTLPFGDISKTAKTIEKTQEDLSYTPRTKTGEALSDIAAYPFKKLGEGLKTFADPVAEAGYPATGALIEAIPQAALGALPLLFRKGSAKPLGRVDATPVLEALGKEPIASNVATAADPFFPLPYKIPGGVGTTIRQIVERAVPRVGVPVEGLDTVMKGKGWKNYTEAALEFASSEMERHVDGWTKDDQVGFIDRVKKGKDQPTPEMTSIANFLGTLDQRLFQLIKDVNPNAAWLEDHYRVLWKKIPFSEKEGGHVGTNRPWEGTKGFLKQHTLKTMSEGIAAGGEPISYNPVTMFKANFSDVMKYVTTQKSWENLKTQKLARFVSLGGKIPEGFTRLNDKISRVLVPTDKYGSWKRSAEIFETENVLREFTKDLEAKETVTTSGGTGEAPATLGRGDALVESRIKEALRARGFGEGESVQMVERIKKAPSGTVRERLVEKIIEKTVEKTREKHTLITEKWEPGKGFVHAGDWYVENGVGRILNNMLSRDLIRESPVGSGLMWLKNATTAMELSLSPFHAVFETLEAISSGMGLGMQKMWNRGVVQQKPLAILEGLKDIITAPITPFTTARTGGSVLRYMKDPREFINTTRGEKFIERFPAAKDLVADLFTSGGKMAMHEDYRINSWKTFRQAVNENNYTGAALRAIPGINDLMMGPLFKEYIPRLKMGMFLKEYSHRLELLDEHIRSGKLTREQVGRRTWDFVEDRLGEMNFDNLFWDRTFKSGMQLLIRSVTWKLGNLRGFGKAFVNQAAEFKNAFKEKRVPMMEPEMAWVWGLASLTAAISSIIQMMSVGELPNSMEDIAYPRIDKEGTRVSVPTYFRDMVHLKNKPLGYLTSSTSGWLGAVHDISRNKDFSGMQVHDPETTYIEQRMDDVMHMFPVPFSLQSVKRLQEQRQPLSMQFLAMGGFPKGPAYIDSTEAVQLASEIRGETVFPAVTKEQSAQRKRIGSLARELESALSSQDPERVQTAKTHIKEDVQASLLDAPAVKKIVESATHTKLQRLIKGMSLKDTFKVWDVSSGEEKKSIGKLIATKFFNSSLEMKTEHSVKFRAFAEELKGLIRPVEEDTPLNYKE